MYTNQTLCVKWSHALSHLFSVKQSDVLSTILFAIYTDGLLKRLQDTGEGCHTSHYLSSALDYADDLTLMAPHFDGTKRIQPARGWCATVGGNTVQIVSTYPASPEARPPSFLGKPAVRSRSMAGGAPTPCGRH